MNDNEVLMCKDYFYKTTGIPIGNKLNDPNININGVILAFSKTFVLVSCNILSFFIYNIGNYWNDLKTKDYDLLEYLETKPIKKTKK